MTEDNCPPRVSSSGPDSSTTKQRKRRKWDQPDESLVSAGVAVPGVFPLANMGTLARITLPAVPAVSGASLAIPYSASSPNPLQMVQVPFQQHAAAIVQKLIQPKIQDELVAREIIINDADSAIRYKLTKRQTQEEIQKCTGAVVITRGKYRPPNALPDGERPLYLHISAAAHLETTAERIKAVDLAATMVEEMLKHASMNNGVKVNHLLSTCVFLGFEADPSFNIASRIRGPNDQYVNHIMNETGATVLLRGRGSGSHDNDHIEEAAQPLHLLLSSNDPKSLEHAKLLAENLLDTISTECGASRVSSCKVYGAVPPPPQLLAGVQSPGNISEVNHISSSSSPGTTNVVTQCSTSQSMGVLSPGLPQANSACYPHASLVHGTSYIGYGGIYPQVMPLQQVALALRQSTSPVIATVSPSTTAVRTEPSPEASRSVKDRHSQKRKFQELPSASNGPANPIQVFSLTFSEANRLILDFYVGHFYVSGFTNMEKNLQGSEFPVPRELTSHVGGRDISVVQSPKNVVQPSSIGMPPPPPRSLSPLSPPPKFSSILKQHTESHTQNKSKPEVVPDTLVKLMEYGDDDDDDDLEQSAAEPLKNHLSIPAAPKPFWAA